MADDLADQLAVAHIPDPGPAILRRNHGVFPVGTQFSRRDWRSPHLGPLPIRCGEGVANAMPHGQREIAVHERGQQALGNGAIRRMLAKEPGKPGQGRGRVVCGEQIFCALDFESPESLLGALSLVCLLEGVVFGTTPLPEDAAKPASKSKRQRSAQRGDRRMAAAPQAYPFSATDRPGVDWFSAKPAFQIVRQSFCGGVAPWDLFAGI